DGIQGRLVGGVLVVRPGERGQHVADTRLTRMSRCGVVVSHPSPPCDWPTFGPLAAPPPTFHARSHCLSPARVAVSASCRPRAGSAVPGGAGRRRQRTRATTASPDASSRLV